MNIRLSDEQLALVASTSALLSKIAEAPAHDGFPAHQWQGLAAAGLFGLGIPHDLGGEGGSGVEQALVMEEAGRVLLASPLASTYAALSALAMDQEALSLVPSLLAARMPALLLPEAAADASPSCGLTDISFGSQTDIWAQSQLIVPVAEPDGRVQLRLVLGRDVNSRFVSTMDVGRPRATATQQLASVRVVGDADADLSRTARRHHQVLLAAEAVGIGQACLDLAVAHVTTREAFGRPIATYQAVAFPLADAYGDLALSRALVHRAAWALTHDPARRDALAAGALARASEAAVLTSERAIHVHGGLGMSWDAPLHRYYKRALSTAVEYGGGAALRQVYLRTHGSNAP